MDHNLEHEQREIMDGLLALLGGKDKRLTLVACLSIAATSAHMIGMPKLAAQEIFVRCYDKRVKEESAL